MKTVPIIGDYGLVPMRKELGRLIRVGQWLNGSGFKNYEHTFIYVGSGYIVEAEPKGAKRVPLSTYGAGEILWSNDPTLVTAERVMIAATAVKLADAHVPYSFVDYAAIAAHRLHIAPNLFKSYVASSKHMICSQLVDYCYQQAGVKLFKDGRWPGYVTPADLANLIQA